MCLKLFDQAVFLLQFSSPGKGKSLQQRKAKPPKKQEEKEKRGKVKPQEDELKDTLADDDSSSTTTETSNPDTEPLLREVCVHSGASDRLAQDTLTSHVYVSPAEHVSCVVSMPSLSPCRNQPSSDAGQLCFPWRRAFGNISQKLKSC